MLGRQAPIAPGASAPVPAVPENLRRGVTLPSLFGGEHREHTGGATGTGGSGAAGAEAPSDRALDASYRELLRERMASTNKAPVPEIAPGELDTLENLFHGADTNADGVVDYAEFRGVMELLSKTTGKRYNTLQLRGLFRLADLDGSGSIDFNEFIHAQRRMQKNWGTAKAVNMMMAMQARSGRGPLREGPNALGIAL